MSKNIVQFIKFVIVGSSNTIISIVTYWILVYFNLEYLLATIIAYVVSSIWGYVLNKKWVFRTKDTKTFASVIKYYVVYGSSLIINLLGMYLLVESLRISKFIAPILIMCITVPYNFIFNKLWAFKDKLREE